MPLSSTRLVAMPVIHIGEVGPTYGGRPKRGLRSDEQTPPDVPEAADETKVNVSASPTTSPGDVAPPDEPAAVSPLTAPLESRTVRRSKKRQTVEESLSQPPKDDGVFDLPSPLAPSPPPPPTTTKTKKSSAKPKKKVHAMAGRGRGGGGRGRAKRRTADHDDDEYRPDADVAARKSRPTTPPIADPQETTTTIDPTPDEADQPGRSSPAEHADTITRADDDDANAPSVSPTPSLSPPPMTRTVRKSTKRRPLTSEERRAGEEATAAKAAAAAAKAAKRAERDIPPDAESKTDEKTPPPKKKKKKTAATSVGSDRVKSGTPTIAAPPAYEFSPAAPIVDEDADRSADPVGPTAVSHSDSESASDRAKPKSTAKRSSRARPTRPTAAATNRKSAANKKRARDPSPVEETLDERDERDDMQDGKRRIYVRRATDMQAGVRSHVTLSHACV